MFDFVRRSSTATDPVCGMDVDTKNPPGGSHEPEGTTYYFCSPGCRIDFQNDAEGYLSREKKAGM